MLPVIKQTPFYPPVWGAKGSDTGLGIRLLPGAKVFYVQSVHPNADNNNDGTDPDYPLATLAQAHTNATAGNGDIIILGQGHVETVATAGAITLSKRAISVIGIGQGADRPTFTFNGVVGASIVISGGAIRVENILCLADIDGLTNPLHIQAADCALKAVEWRDATDKEAARAVLTTANADRLTIDGFIYDGIAAGDACANAFRLVGVDRAEIKNCQFQGNFSTAIIEFHTTACKKVNIHDSLFLETGTVDYSKSTVDTVTGSTWGLWHCFDTGAGTLFHGGSGAALAAG